MTESSTAADTDRSTQAGSYGARDGASRVRAGQRIRWLSPRRIGALYLWALIILVFSLWKPSLFFSAHIANGYAISAIASLAVLIPLVAGVFDVSVGATMTLSGVVVAKLLSETHLSIFVVLLLGVGVGVLVGLFNALIVVVLRIPSLIGTLAALGIIDSVAVGVSGNQTLSSTRLSGDFAKTVAASNLAGFTRPVLYVLVLMLILGVVLEQTQLGRFMYAVGFNPASSRLAGLRVSLLQSGALVAGSVIGAFAGVVLAAQVSSASPGAGSSYLLPAFAAVFLGSTQFRDLRFNAWGTVVAVFMLGTGQYGLLLVGAPQWMPNVFQGAALVTAIAVTQFGARGRLGQASV